MNIRATNLIAHKRERQVAENLKKTDTYKYKEQCHHSCRGLVHSTERGNAGEGVFTTLLNELTRCAK